jgi:hypothetical protein
MVVSALNVSLPYLISPFNSVGKGQSLDLPSESEIWLPYKSTSAVHCLATISRTPLPISLEVLAAAPDAT